MRRGDLAAARRNLETCRKLEPDDVETEFELGNLCRCENRHDDAIAHYLRAADLGPQYPAIRVTMGLTLELVGRYDEAIAANRAAIALRASAPAFNNLGNCYLAKEMIEEAVDAYHSAMALEPDALTAHNLGNAMRSLLRLEDACHWFEETIRLDPTMAAGHNGLGNTYRDQGDYAKARRAYEDGLAGHPDDRELLYNLGLVLVETGALEEAISVGKRGVASNPTFAPAHFSLARACAASGEHREALKWVRAGLDLDPDDVAGLMALAATCAQLWMPEPEIAALKSVLDIDPGCGRALALLVNAVLSLCDWQKYREFSAKLIERVADPGQDDIASISVFNLQALPVPYAFIAEGARAAAQAVTREMAPLVASTRLQRRARVQGRLRIGYLLSYTFRHSLPHVLKTVVEHHDRDRFEIFGYSISPHDGSTFSAAYRASFDRFSDVGVASPVGAAQRISDDGIDILVDVAGHTPVNCMPVLAFHPAPVQAHFLGYSITTGADFIDYLITDRVFMPEHCARHNRENHVFLPDTFMTAPPVVIAEASSGHAELDLPADGFVFANFNHPCKFEPEIFAAWMRLLERVPGSVLWLGRWMDATCDNLRREAEAAGIDPERLVFSEIATREVHCARLSHADLALDNRYHGGGVTTIDALAAGVPVLTVTGDTPAGRLGATLLSAAGIPEMITVSLADYEARALDFARNPEALEAIRRKLGDGLATCAQFDTRRYTRHLERGFELIWERHATGKAPADIEVPASR